jgi:hypothetical protein
MLSFTYFAHFHVVVDGGDVKRTLSILVGRVDRVLPLSQKPPDKILPAGLNRLVKWKVEPVVFEPQICRIFFQDF